MSQVEAVSPHESRLSGGGAIGNERLTTVNGVLLIALAALGMNAKLHFRADVNHLTGARRQSLYPNVERCTVAMRLDRK
jgi:hypothetical protein